LLATKTIEPLKTFSHKFAAVFGRTAARWLPVLLGCCVLFPSAAQTNYGTLRSFGFPLLSAANPRTRLILGSDGALYGTTEYGGASDAGTVFKLSTNGSGFAVLKSFTGSGSDGARPFAGLVESTNGRLYGTTCYGGSNGLGTVFSINKDGSGYVVLKQFNTNGADGQNPRSALIEASDGLLYGTTYWGGSSNVGTVFGLSKDGNSYSVLYSFTGLTNDDGQPCAGLVEGTNGMLFGTTSVGITNNWGTIFALNKNGSGYAVLKLFTNSASGRGPHSGLMLGSDGVLYGTTRSGGSSNSGAIFALNQNGSGYSVLYSFTGTNNGAWPFGKLLEGLDGALYGTAYWADPTNMIIVFRINKNGTGYTVLTNFTASYGGGRPEAGLVQTGDGTLYGTAYSGGPSGFGTLFELNPDGSGLTILQNFSPSGGDGRYPSAAFEASDGAIYGATSGGGSNDVGTLFKMNRDGTGYALLQNFGGTNMDAQYPNVILESINGVLYGTTDAGGSNNFGTVFTINTNGTGYTVLYQFNTNNNDGRVPTSLIEASDGLLYGTTYLGGSNVSSLGTIFKLKKDGTGYAEIRSFAGGTADGSYPASIMEGSDGVLYGTTESGGASSSTESGTVFRINKNGSGFVLLMKFQNNSAGFSPWGRLVQGSDGALYGTTTSDPNKPTFFGTVFKINTNGTGFTTLRQFTGTNALDGSTPYAGVLEAADGALYGMTGYGGSNNLGTVFSLNKDGQHYAILQHFTGTNGNGGHPQASLTKGAAGALYGTAPDAGDMGLGTVFRFFSPVVITGIGNNGTALLNLQGASNQVYHVEATASLNPPSWQGLGSNSLSGSTAQFPDPSSAGYPMRFYRTVSP